MNVLKNYGNSLILIASMILGGLFGHYYPHGAEYISPVADLFLNLLYCLIVPLVFVSLVSAITKMTDLKRLKKILLWIIGLTILTEVLSAIYMIVVVGFFNPAAGVVLPMTEHLKDLESNSNLLSMFTVSDFNLLFSRKSLLALVVFTLAFGIASASLPNEQREKVATAFDILERIVMKLVSYVMKIAPIGLFALFAGLIQQQGDEILGPLLRTFIIFFGAAIGYYILSTTLYGYFAGGNKGVAKLWKQLLDPSLTALGTSSSAASIPSNFVASKALGISPAVRDLTIPLGANLHKDGAVLIQVVKVALICGLLNIPFFTVETIATTLIVSVLSASVIGAIPGGGYVGVLFLAAAFGFPPETLPIMILVGSVTDAASTVINVTGDLGLGLLVDKFTKNKNDSAVEELSVTPDIIEI